MLRKINAIGFAAVLVFAAVRCGSPTEPPPLPAGAIPLGPPAIYLTWWREVEHCSGKTGDFAAVSWYYVPGPAGFSSGTGADVVGVWQASGNAITLAEFAREDGWIVRHEELHAILMRTDHPAEFFAQRCGAEVAH